MVVLISDVGILSVFLYIWIQSPGPISSFTSVEENGIVELSPDRVYKGSLIHGVPNGEGIVIDPCVNEVIYDGMWRMDCIMEWVHYMFKVNKWLMESLYEEYL